eukprot:9131950-Alexandrium_andersonii.AAC.1
MCIRDRRTASAEWAASPRRGSGNRRAEGCGAVSRARCCPRACKGALNNARAHVRSTTACGTHAHTTWGTRAS